MTRKLLSFLSLVLLTVTTASAAQPAANAVSAAAILQAPAFNYRLGFLALLTALIIIVIGLLWRRRSGK